MYSGIRPGELVRALAGAFRCDGMADRLSGGSVARTVLAKSENAPLLEWASLPYVDSRSVCAGTRGIDV